MRVYAFIVYAINKEAQGSKPNLIVSNAGTKTMSLSRNIRGSLVMNSQLTSLGEYYCTFGYQKHANVMIMMVGSRFLEGGVAIHGHISYFSLPCRQ